jgi:hypothetical protein
VTSETAQFGDPQIYQRLDLALAEWPPAVNAAGGHGRHLHAAASLSNLANLRRHYAATRPRASPKRFCRQ